MLWNRRQVRFQELLFQKFHYEYLVETKNRNYKVHTTENYEIGKKVGLTIDPFDIQVMHKMEN